MFGKLFDTLLDWIDRFACAVIVHEYERGVILRWGRFHREVGPGWHWHWPLCVETPLVDNVVVTTTNLGPQSLTTEDGISVTVAAIVTWRVADVRKVLLEVEGKQEVMLDTTYGVIAAHVARTKWAEMQAPDLAHEVTKEVRRRAKDYGIAVSSVQFSDLVRCRPLRLWAGATLQGR